MAIIDCFSYNGEREMLQLHLNTLEHMVDKFVIVEAKTTFSGNKKKLHFFEDQEYVRRFWPRIEYYIIGEDYSQKEIALAESSPNTRGASHWKREFLQKESIQKALKYAKVQDDDLVYIGDVDEIWTPHYANKPEKLKLRVYAYYLNNRSNEEFWGTLVARYGDIKDQCLNHLRSDTSIGTKNYHGWHFTSMGGIQEVRRKLDDSYTEDSYNTKTVQKLLQQRVESGTDYLGRDFAFTIDGTEWPNYLKENRMQYAHLCKH